MSTIAQFLALLASHGSPATYHRDAGTVDCPCLTPEGFRDPIWHVQHPLAPVCNSEGKLPSVDERVIQAFIQPAQSTRATRLSDEVIQALVGEVRADDHIGILPLTWNSQSLNYNDWSQNGADWIGYNGKKFFIVNVNILPDPSDGNPNHHAECGLRVMET